MSNNNPIFLLHGFMGWGRDELGSYKYFWQLIENKKSRKDKR